MASDGESITTKRRELWERLTGLTMEFEEAGGYTGNEVDLRTARILRMLADVGFSGRESPRFAEAYRAAVGHFDGDGASSPAPVTRLQDGADELHELLEWGKRDGESNAELAVLILARLHELRPGLARSFADAPDEAERHRIAAEMRETIVKALEKADRSRWDVGATPDYEEWADKATRLVLGALGDRRANNALKHRLKK